MHSQLKHAVRLVPDCVSIFTEVFSIHSSRFPSHCQRFDLKQSYQIHNQQQRPEVKQYITVIHATVQYTQTEPNRQNHNSPFFAYKCLHHVTHSASAINKTAVHSIMLQVATISKLYTNSLVEHCEHWSRKFCLDSRQGLFKLFVWWSRNL